MKRKYTLFIILIILACTSLLEKRIKPFLSPLTNRILRKSTIAERIEQYGSSVKKRLMPYFEANGVSYPPNELIFVGLKREKILEVWARNGNSAFTKIRDYPILGASGKLGPKLKEGDKQVPEGIYRIESLNPNSRFHLSLRLNYPNESDFKHARTDGRKNLGGDIMIHGSSVSVGCLAMGNEAIEDLFILSAQTGINNIEVILSPLDFRKSELSLTNQIFPIWTKELYSRLKQELGQLKP